VHLDGSGVETLTMRRLAERLTVTSTALYWHVHSRDDVLDLAVDEVFGEVPLPGPTADRAADVRTLVHGWRAAMLAHPSPPPGDGRTGGGCQVRRPAAGSCGSHDGPSTPGRRW
jgi:AcrR family transcriptional regulator